MPFKIVRNDITKMNTEAIVNTANDMLQLALVVIALFTRQQDTMNF